MEGFAVVLTVVVALGTALYLRYYRRAISLISVGWATNRGIPADAAEHPLVSDYVLQSGSLRAIGVATGLAMPAAVAVAFGMQNTPAGAAWPYVGYSAGAFFAAAVPLTPTSEGRRRATLSPRSLSNYLSRRLLSIQRITPAVVGCLAAIALLLPYPEARDRGDQKVLSWALGAIACAVVGEALQRRVVARRQPYDDQTIVAADDAIRSHVVQTVAGASVGITVLAASSICGALAMSDVQLLRWTMWVPAIFGPVAAIFACLAVVDRPWRVLRPTTRRT